MSTVIRSLMVKVGADLTDMQKGMAQASKDLKNIGKSFSSAGATLTKGLTVPIIAAVSGLTALSVKAGETADELITLSNQTGVSTKTLQALGYASRFVDVEVSDMAKGIAKVAKATGQATAAGDDYITIANGLSVGIRDSSGQLKSSEQIFYDAVDAMGGMTNETEREIAAQSLFGKSYQDMMPLIIAGTGALKKYAEEAQKMGLVISDKDLAAMGEFDDKMQSLKAIMEVAGAKIGTAFMPVIEKMVPVLQEKLAPAAEKLARFLSKLIDRFNNLSPGMQKFILAALASAVALGPVFTVIGKVTMGLSGAMGAASKASKAFKGASTVFTGIKAAMAAFLSPAGLVLLAIVAIAVAAFLIIKNWDKIKGFFSKLWAAVKAIFVGTWAVIKAIFLDTTPIGLIIKNWGAIKTFFSALWGGIKNIFSGAWGAIKGVINGMIGGIETFINGGVKGINLLVKGLNKIIGLGSSVAKLFGFNAEIKIPTIKKASLPRLAGGTVINPNHEFAAILGDQKSGINIETPLKTMVNAFETSLNKHNSAGTINHTGTIRVVGVNNQNELIGVTKLIADQVQRDSRRTPSAISYSPA